MSDSFTEAFDAPATERIGGEDVVFPLLTLADHAGWVSSLHAYRKAADTKLVPEDATATERFEILRRIEREPSLAELGDTVFTLSGARKCLILSLKKSGKSESDAAAAVGQLAPKRLVPLAIQVSGLFEPKPKKNQGAKTKGKSDPNADAGGEVTEADSTATG